MKRAHRANIDFPAHMLDLKGFFAAIFTHRTRMNLPDESTSAARDSLSRRSRAPVIGR
jgi:hypothetical protein